MTVTDTVILCVGVLSLGYCAGTLIQLRIGLRMQAKFVHEVQQMVDEYLAEDIRIMNETKQETARLMDEVRKVIDETL